jgi:hypothetical protein
MGLNESSWSEKKKWREAVGPRRKYKPAEQIIKLIGIRLKLSGKRLPVTKRFIS